jgi:hypothetical protein
MSQGFSVFQVHLLLTQIRTAEIHLISHRDTTSSDTDKPEDISARGERHGIHDRKVTVTTTVEKLLKN